MKTIAHHTSKAFALLHKHVMKHKKYHHYFLLSLITLSLGFFLYNKVVHVQAATYNFTQASWAGIASTTKTANHASDRSSTWIDFSAISSSSVIPIDSGVSLAVTSKSITNDGFANATWASISASGTPVVNPSSGDAYVASGITIYKITPSGSVSSFATLGAITTSLVFDSLSNLYAVNSTTVYKITPSGASSTFATITGGSNPSTVIDSSDNLYTANQTNGNLYKITPSGAVSTLAVTSKTGFLVIDTQGNLYTGASGGSGVYKITPTGAISSLVVAAFPRGGAVDTSGNLFVSIGTTTYKIPPTFDTYSTFATITGAASVLTIDSLNNLYTVNTTSNLVYKITPAGTVSTLATVGAGPINVKVDSAGNIYTVNTSTISKLLSNGGFEAGTFLSTVQTGTSTAASVVLGGALGVTTTGSPTHTTVGGYEIYKYTGSGTFQITSGTADVEYLVVGGGGAGGSSGAGMGGGGAGGFRTGTLPSMATGTYAVTVGAGGVASGASGATSTFSTINASGGGGGGKLSATTGLSGGSGGGGAAANGIGGSGNTPPTAPSQGNDGGTNNSVSISGGGGGGAGAPGIGGTDTIVGDGGTGLTSSIALLTTCPAGGTAPDCYYAGGGGGGRSNVPYTVGGTGGGGATATNGTANTGGGGGGRGPSTPGVFGTGGSGVVIVRYPQGYVPSGTFTSAIIDTGAYTNFTTLSVASTTSTGTTTVSIKVRSSNSSSMTGANAFSDCSVVANGENLSTGGCITNGHRYVQYEATLTTTDTAVTPTLDSVTINNTQYAVGGNLTSSKYDTTSDANIISNINWTATATSTNEVIKFQLRSASTSDLLDTAIWCGPTICGASADYFTTSTGIVGGINSASSTHILSHGGDDKWLQYKVFLISGGAFTPVLNNVTVQYVVNAPPDFDATYGANGVSVNQISNSADANWGKTQIDYAIRDVDGDSGSITPNYVIPTFEYSLDNGSNWTNISSSTLAYVSAGDGALARYIPGSGTSTLSSPYTGGIGSGSVINLISTSTYKTYTVYWDAKSQIPNIATTTAKIRVTISDSEAANSTANVNSATFNLDSVNPTGTITFDAGIAGQVSSAVIHIAPVDATTSVQYLITDDSSNSSPISTGWVSTTTSGTTTIPWTFDADVEAKTLKFQFRDAFGNTTATTTLTTSEPIPSTSFLIQDTSSVLSTPPTYSMYIGWQVSTSTNFADYELEYATSTNNSTYGPYAEVSEITASSTIYYVHGDLNTNYYYRYRLGVRDVNGNISVRPTVYTTAKPDGVQNYGEGGGGTSMTAPVMKNIFPVQGGDGKVTVTYTLTDVNKTVKTNPSYEGYLFYDNGVTITTSSADTITMDDASKMPSSGYIQIKDEVIKYTTKTGNVLSGLTRGTWPTDGTTRTTNANVTFFTNTPVWVMATSTSPVLITPDTNVSTGLAGSIVWDTTKESTLAGSVYRNVGMRVLVHDNQPSGSGPITTQNISSDDGKLLNLNVSVPTIEFISVSTPPMDQSIATTSDKFKVKLSKAYPFDVTFSYALSGTAENDGVDYTMATTTVTIPAGATTTNIYADITPSNSSNISVGDKTIIVTINSPTNAILGTNISSVYTIHNSYINPPEFAQASVISQITSGNDLGKVLIAYSIRDVDAGNSTNGVSNIATSTFKYSLDNGVTWVTITNLNDGSLDGKTVDAVTYTTLSGTFASTTNSTTALWDVASQLATSTSDLKIKVTTTAGTIKPTSAATTSNSISLDAKKPVVTLNLNLSTGTTSLNISDDNIISYKISNNSDLSSDSVNALSTGNWINVGATSLNSSSTAWTFNSLTNPIVYYSVKDELGNTVATTSNSAPAPIANVQLKDVSNVSLNTYSEVLTWDNFSATTTATFGKYQIYRATSTDSNYSLLSEITDASTISYRDNSVASSTMYYYKLLAVDSDGDISGYSNMVNDTPDGSSGSAVALNITNASTTDITSNSVTITWTTNEYATSTVEYSDPGTVGVFSNSVTSSVLSKTHSITLSNLISGASYTYQIKSTDIADSTVTDHNGDTGYYSFTTKGGPRITNVHTTQGTLTDTTASIFWDTNILSDSDVYYSTNSLTVNSATSSVHLRDATATTSHQIDITGLSQATTYYFKVVSASAEDATLTSTDDNKNTTYPFNVQFHTFTTLGDNVAPTISNISVPVKSPTSAVIVWTTNELATSQVQWGTSSSTLDHSSTLDSFKVLNHNVSISGLTSEVTYYFKVLSIDNSSHATSSEIQSFTTTKDGVVIVIQVVSSSGNGTQDDATPPVIISANVDEKSIGSFNADVKVETDEPVRAFVTYGETTKYGSTEGDNTLSTSKTISLKKLKTGTDYHYRVQVIDKAGNDVISADKTFKTKFISELLDDRAFVDKADDLQGKIEQLLESALPSLSPPYVSTPVISNITENSVTINWNTNIKTIGSLSYATDEDYTAKNTYGLDVSTGLDKSANHNVDLVNLKSNTKYHIQAKSYVFPQVMGKSADITFVTKAAKVKADILEKKKDGFTVAWSTDEPTTSIVEYKNLRTGETNRTADNTKKTYHAVKIENLPSATSYTVKVSGVNGNDNTIEAADAIDVTTSSDTIPPTISNFKVDNALVPGRTDRIQTVVGWQTDEPANSVVYYQEGAGTPGDTAELANKVESLDNYTANHIMILASLKPGAIYRLKVISTDEGGNAKVFGPRTIITPRQTESVLDIIFKNFEDTFKFLRQ